MKPLIQTTHFTIQEAFASTLIHSLWQGAIIVVLMWLIKIALRENKTLNYLLSLFALIAVVLTSVCTFLFIWNQNSLTSYPNTLLSEVLDRPEVFQWFNIIWLIGSSIFFLRFLFSHFYLRKLIDHSKPLINNQWIEIFNKLKNYYAIHRSIILLQSDKVGSAFLTGVIKPVIIIPTSWVNQLSFKEAECILAHELSHVFNKDHWVNLFLHFSEIIFYFNPAVHILISHIKLERELKADSSACQYLQEPMLYAKLILKIEESYSFAPALTLPFFQQRKQLKRRIESVLNIHSSKNEFTSGLAIFALSLGVLFFGTISSKKHVSVYYTESSHSISCDNLSFKLDVPLKKKIYSICIPEKRISRPINKINKIKEVQTNNEIIINSNNVKEIDPEENDNQSLAYVDDSQESDILQQIEREIKAERNNHMTIIYEISKNTEIDSNESIHGGNWVTPRQIKYYAPSETKTYIIIKSRNAPSVETESDWYTPGYLRIQTIDKH